MAKFTDKISNLINSQAPEFVLEQHPKFLEFLRLYYTFMESAELTVVSVQTTEGILLETETNQNNQLILDGSRLSSERTIIDAGDKIILESSAFGKFTNGETITGQTSNATATVLGEDLDNGRLFISAQDKFLIGETVLGNSSNASAIINNYKPNPVQNIQELLNFRDPDKVISNFLTKFRNEFLNTLPEQLDADVDKRNLIKNIRSLYKAKGTAAAHQLFFRLLFNEDSETFYPRENMLRVSDGKWDELQILRTIINVGDPANLIGRTITGQTSGATAIPENVIKFQIGSNVITEFILNEDSITGTFQIGEEVRGTASNIDDTFIKTTVTGIPTSISIINDGNLYLENDAVAITSSGGEAGIIQVNAVGRGGISEFIIENAGTGYSIGDDLVFNNTNTGGGSAVAKVAVVNGGFTLEESTSTVDDHIVLENETLKGDTYTGNKLVQEEATGVGDITDIRIISQGFNYISLPTITVSSSGGSDARILAYGTEIGRLQDIKIVEYGAYYDQSPSPPILVLPTNLILTNIIGSGFVSGETISGFGVDGSTVITATVSSFNNSVNLLRLTSASGVFGTESTITGSITGTTATIKKFDQGTASAIVGTLALTSGKFINQDGHVSETSMRIQDSLYYQDFSYVIKVGQVINNWRDSFKKSSHTAGFYFTGQVTLQTQISARISSPVEGIISGLSETPIFSLINTLFSTIFGRRLGTEDDGTSLNANPELGLDPLFDTSTTDFFTPNTRDLTLTRKMKVSFPSIAKITVRGTEYNFGYAYCGPRMKTLNIYNNPFGTDNMFSGNHPNVQIGTYTATGGGTTQLLSPMKMVNWADHTIIGLNNSLNGTGVQIQDYDNDNLKTYISYPTEITASVPGITYDRTNITFDNIGFTFDETF